MIGPRLQLRSVGLVLTKARLAVLSPRNLNPVGRLSTKDVLPIVPWGILVCSRKRTISPMATPLPLVWASEVSRVLLMAPRAWLTTDWLAFLL